MRKPRAFTLIEMLMVIGIIALLVGIILAVLPAARKRSYEARCMSNLRQLGYAFAMYKQDWGGIEAERGQYYEPWQLGLPPRVYVRNTDGSITVTVGEFRVWKCQVAPFFENPLSLDYATNYTSCISATREELEDPYSACNLWREAVFRLGQKAWLLLDDNHRSECAIARQGHCPVILLNLNFEVRRFSARWDTRLSNILWQEH